MSEILLLRMMNALLAQMSVISEQRAHDYDKGRISGSKSPGPPRLDEKPLADYYRDRFAGCTTYAGRRQVVLDGVEALKLARRADVEKQQNVEPEPWSLPWQIMLGRDKRTVEEIVRIYGPEAHRVAVEIGFPDRWLSKRTVHRYRDQYRRLSRGIVPSESNGRLTA